MRSLVKIATFWAVLITSAIGLALLVSIPVQQSIYAQNELVKPYTIHYYGLATSAEGEAIPYSFLVASKSNTDSMSQDDKSNSPRVLKLAAAGLLIAVAPSGRNIMTMGNGKPIASQKFGDNCEGYTGHTSETKTILGFRTIKVVSVGGQQSPDGKDSTRDMQESWLAPDLNCQHLEQKTTWTYNGQPNDVTTETADWAIAGEPDAALFKLPEDPVEVPPSVFYPALGRPFESRMEAMYHRRKAERAAAAGLQR